MYKIAIVATLFLLTACSTGQEDNSYESLDGESLAKAKCSACHNLDFPAKTSDHEKAPPFYTVTHHVKQAIEAGTDYERRMKFIDFVSDYPLNPSVEKSYCDKVSLKYYGLMPSQKGKVTKTELKAIASYMYNRYDQKKLLAIMQERSRLARLPLHEQVLEKYQCKICHSYGGGKVGPLFKQIAQKYKNDSNATAKIIDAIKHGSKGKWHLVAPMKAYPEVTEKQLKATAKWILEQK